MAATPAELLKRLAADHGSRVALIEGDRAVSYAEYWSEARALASAFEEGGVRRGDRVAVILPNCLEFAYVFAAAAHLGVVAVLINVRYSPDEIAYLLDDADPKAVVTCRAFAGGNQLDVVRSALRDGGRSAAVFVVREAEVDAGGSIRSFPDARSHDLAPTWSDGQMDDPLLIIYTSGTTGRPKGALLTQRNVFCSAAGYGERLELTPDDRLSVFTPMFHAGGIVNGIATALWAGATAVLVPSFERRTAVRILQESRVTVYLAVPTMLLSQFDLINDGIDADFSSIRTIVSGGSPVTPEVAQQAIQLFRPQNFQVVYGLSEANMATLSAPGEPASESSRTVGTATRPFEVRVVDSERRALPEGEVGEVAIKGCGVFLGYWRRPEATAEVLDADGWFYTGDLGRLDQAGRLQIVGRLKEMYIQGGSNVYPAELERVLQDHPAVALAAVIGIPDQLLGEKGCAFIVLKEGARLDADALLDFASRRLAKFKLPRVVHFRDSLPLTAFGKVQKSLLRAEVRQPDAHL